MAENLTPRDYRDFLREAGVAAEAEYEVRQIGADSGVVGQILARIASGEKSMTFSLPWLAELKGLPVPEPGRYLIVVDTAGEPRLLLRLESVRRLRFGEVEDGDLEREGEAMRSVEAWKPLHREVWSRKLAHYGLEPSDEMPVWAECFEVVYEAPD